MSPLLKVKKADRCDEWLTMDMRDDDDFSALVIIPLFGKNHRAGPDCWCQPLVEHGEEDMLVVHNACH